MTQVRWETAQRESGWCRAVGSSERHRKSISVREEPHGARNRHVMVIKSSSDTTEVKIPSSGALRPNSKLLENTQKQKLCTTTALDCAAGATAVQQCEGVASSFIQQTWHTFISKRIPQRVRQRLMDDGHFSGSPGCPLTLHFGILTLACLRHFYEIHAHASKTAHSQQQPDATKAKLISKESEGATELSTAGTSGKRGCSTAGRKANMVVKDSSG